MNVELLITLIPVLATVVAAGLGRHFWERNQGRDRNELLGDRRFLQRWIVRPLYLLGEPPDIKEEHNRPPSILPRPVRHVLPAPPPAPPGTFALKGMSPPERCEVCHQTDCFNPQTGECGRCGHRTL